MMAYDYIKSIYQVTPLIGQRVRHHVTKKEGTISRENRSASHYVQVRFDGDKHALPCHPTEMDYLTPKTEDHECDRDEALDSLGWFG